MKDIMYRMNELRAKYSEKTGLECNSIYVGEKEQKEITEYIKKVIFGNSSIEEPFKDGMTIYGVKVYSVNKSNYLSVGHTIE